MDKTEEHILGEKEKAEVKNMVREARAIYEYILYIENEGVGTNTLLMDDSRFMEVTFINTRNLVRHSSALNTLTRRLNNFTFVLIILACAQLFFILNMAFKWF